MFLILWFVFLLQVNGPSGVRVLKHVMKEFGWETGHVNLVTQRYRHRAVTVHLAKVRSRTFVSSFVCSLIRFRLFVRLFVCFFVRSFVCPSSFSFIRSFICLFLYFFVRSFVRCQGENESIVRSCVCRSARSFVCSFVRACVPSLARLPVIWIKLWIAHSVVFRNLFLLWITSSWPY